LLSEGAVERVILKQDVGYCELEGHLYFLDVSRDRYLGASASWRQLSTSCCKVPSCLNPPENS
jgi:hypothetical protein